MLFGRATDVEQVSVISKVVNMAIVDSIVEIIYIDKKEKRTQDMALGYAKAGYRLGFRVEAGYGDKLRAVVGNPPDTIVSQFFDQYLVIDCIEGLLEVNKDATCNFLPIESCANSLSDVNKSMIGRVFGTKPILKLVYTFKFFQKAIDSREH